MQVSSFSLHPMRIFFDPLLSSFLWIIIKLLLKSSWKNFGFAFLDQKYCKSTGRPSPSDVSFLNDIKIFTLIWFISVIVFFFKSTLGLNWCWLVLQKKWRPNISFILAQISRFVSTLMLLFRFCAVPSKLNETGTWIGSFICPVQSPTEKGGRIRRGHRCNVPSSDNRHSFVFKNGKCSVFFKVDCHQHCLKGIRFRWVTFFATQTVLPPWLWIQSIVNTH